METSAGFPPTPAPDDRSNGFEIAHGFPFRAFWCAPELVMGKVRPEYRVHGGLQLSPDFLGATGTLRVLPYRPIWPGLAADVGIYAALWLLVVGAPLQVRRALRVRRGCCRACGYSLTGQTQPGCPECGWRREPSSRPG